VQILGLKDFNLEYDGNLLDFVVQDSSEKIIAVTENSKINQLAITTFNSKGIKTDSKIIESLQIGQCLMVKKACLRIMENEKLLICVQNHEDNLFSCIYDSSNLDFNALDGVALDCEISSMKWLSDSRIILQYGKNIEILDIETNRSVFSHEAPKKALEIMNFAVHPLLPNIVCCCDDSKSVQIFWHQT
jgi:hypothetical protein